MSERASASAKRRQSVRDERRLGSPSFLASSVVSLDKSLLRSLPPFRISPPLTGLDVLATLCFSLADPVIIHRLGVSGIVSPLLFCFPCWHSLDVDQSINVNDGASSVLSLGE